MKKLGRGLESLIPAKNKTGIQIEKKTADAPFIEDLSSLKKEPIFYIETNKIKPNPQQPRKNFDEAGLKALAESIYEHGILQPLIITKYEYDTPRGRGVEYFLVAGERRLRAAKLAGLSAVPAIIKRADLSERQKLELALIENVQREDLNALEKAQAFDALAREFNLTQAEIAKRIGKSREAVANAMRLLDLPQAVKRGLFEKKITEGHAKVILAVAGIDKQIALYEEVVKNGLSVRETESLAKNLKTGGFAAKKSSVLDFESREAVRRLEDAFGTKVALTKNKGRGKIVIEFFSDEEFKNIVDKILSLG